jgi:His/Glu/Gln/Arg/opine family amino acid ABC transporter permease subunit
MEGDDNMKKSVGILIFLLLVGIGLIAGCARQTVAPIKSVNDLADKRIGIMSGTLYDQLTNERFPNAQVLRFNTTADMGLALKAGQLDALIISMGPARETVRANPEIGILTEDFFTSQIGVGFNKSNPALRERFNTFLKEVQADGSLEAQRRKWFEQDITQVKMPQYPPQPTGQKIVAGVSAGDLPVSAYVNGEYVGFDIEMIRNFAQREHLQVEFLPLEFSALIASLGSGKVDMIASSISITEERQKLIDFSDSYMLEKTFVLVLKANLAGQSGVVKAAAPTKSWSADLADRIHSNLWQENRYLLILDGLKTTLIISVLSLLLGTLLGAIVCYLRMSGRSIFSGPARFYISVMRGIPVLVLLMITYYVIFANSNISPVLVAVLAFGMNFAAYVAEMFRTAIASIDKGQTEAGIAGGFTPLQTFGYIVLPQAANRVLPVYKGEVISLVKMTSIVGYVAVQDLTKASDIIRSRTFDAFFPLIMTAVLYFAIAALLLQILEVVEKRTDPRRRRQTLKKRNRARNLKMTLIVALICLGGAVLFSGELAAFFSRKTAVDSPITRPADLNGRRVAVITGTTGDFTVRKNYPKAQILDMVYAADAALAVQTRKANAFVFDRNTLQYIIARSNNAFELLPDRVDTVDIAIPMRSADIELHKKINAVIKQFQQDGTLQRLKEKWIDSPPRNPQPPNIVLSGKNGVLRLGTCLLTEPYAFVANGKMAGHDIDLAYLLAEQLGVSLEITDMSFDAMNASLQAGKIDLAIANFYKQEGVEKICVFSIPYIHNDISVLVRRRQP